MRATVLCILAIAGATCALQIPLIPSPQSILDAGSSILGNLPGIKHGDESSTSSSSSDEDHKPSDIAVELAERVVNDIANAAGGIGSIALLPLQIGGSVLESITKDITNFLGAVLNNLNPDGPTVPELAAELAKSVIHDVIKLAKNIGSVVLEPVRFKAELVETIAHGVDKFLKNIQNQASGHPEHRPSSERPRPTHPSHPSSERPRPTHPGHPSGERPRPTHPGHPSGERPSPSHPGHPSGERPSPSHPGHPSGERPRPSHPGHPSGERPSPSHPGHPSGERPRPSHPGHPSGERPRPTQPGHPSAEQPRQAPARSISKENGVNVRVARNIIAASVSGGISIDQVINDSKVRNLGKALVTIDFAKIVKPIPKIPDLTPLKNLAPEVAIITKRARNLVIHTIAAGASTIEEAVQTALSTAIHSVNPAGAIVNLVNIIVQVYFFVAQSALGVPPVAIALLKEAAVVVGSLISSLLAALSDDVADGVRALLN